MNARLFILAMLIIVIVALFTSASTPGQENVFRITLGGDCSADRAAGDLYYPVDLYCAEDQGSALPPTWSMAPNRQGTGQDDNQVDIEAQREDSSNTTVDEQASKRPGADAGAEVDEPTNRQGGKGPSSQRNELPNKRGKDDSKDVPEEQAKDKIVKHLADQNDSPAKSQKANEDAANRQCKKAERDNLNSQGKHDCSAKNPDKNSGQERTKDHNQNEASKDLVQNQDCKQQSQDKNCKKA